MADDIDAEIIAIIAAQALMEPASLAPSSRLADIGLDSLGVVEIIYTIEERFHITVPFNANEPDRPEFDITTVSSVIEAVKSLLAAKA